MNKGIFRIPDKCIHTAVWPLRWVQFRTLHKTVRWQRCYPHTFTLQACEKHWDPIQPQQPTRVNSSASPIRNSGDRGLFNAVLGKPFSGVLGDRPSLDISEQNCSLSDRSPLADSAARIAMARDTSSGLICVTWLNQHFMQAKQTTPVDIWPTARRHWKIRLATVVILTTRTCLQSQHAVR